MDSLNPILLCSLTNNYQNPLVGLGSWGHISCTHRPVWRQGESILFFIQSWSSHQNIYCYYQRYFDVLLSLQPCGDQLPFYSFRWLVSLWVATQEIRLKGRCWLSVSKRAGLRSFKVIMLNIHHAHFTNHSVIRTIMLITSTNCAYHALVMLTDWPDNLLRWCTWSLNTGRKTTRVARGSSRDFSIMCQSSELLSDEIQYQATNIYEIEIMTLTNLFR